MLGEVVTLAQPVASNASADCSIIGRPHGLRRDTLDLPLWLIRAATLNLADPNNQGLQISQGSTERHS
jgi:hypothetical protein